MTEWEPTETERQKLKAIAEEAAKCAVNETFMSFGINPDDRINAQRTFALVFRARKLYDRGIATLLVVTIGMVVTGIGTMVWNFIRTLLKE